MSTNVVSLAPLKGMEQAATTRLSKNGGDAMLEGEFLRNAWRESITALSAESEALAASIRPNLPKTEKYQDGLSRCSVAKVERCK